MTERYRFNEVEFWNGHSLADDCPWEEIHFHFKDVRDEMLYSMSKVGSFKEKNRLFSQLRQYIESNQGRPIRRLGQEEQFRLVDRPKGTIIRFSGDINKPAALIGREFRQYEDEWGLLTQDKFAEEFFDVVIGFTAEQLSRQTAPYGEPPHRLTGNILIGEVIHHRCIERDDTALIPLNRFLDLDKHQYLMRINWLEIWKFGTEIRKKKEQPESDARRLLSPGFIQN